ncbi:hypothetical protein AB0M02_19345 [Actinoplanes sp. NPDC051861]|uniref:hypothetical protein n=1 Tax=Actinoplanes sp. NPDC051861 TaxID=3155170 RepID=UPI0034139F6C
MRDNRRLDLIALLAILGMASGIVLAGQGDMLTAMAIACTSLYGGWQQRHRQPSAGKQKRAEGE